MSLYRSVVPPLLQNCVSHELSNSTVTEAFPPDHVAATLFTHVTRWVAPTSTSSTKVELGASVWAQIISASCAETQVTVGRDSSGLFKYTRLVFPHLLSSNDIGYRVLMQRGTHTHGSVRLKSNTLGYSIFFGFYVGYHRRISNILGNFRRKTAIQSFNCSDIQSCFWF